MYTSNNPIFWRYYKPTYSNKRRVVTSLLPEATNCTKKSCTLRNFLKSAIDKKLRILYLPLILWYPNLWLKFLSFYFVNLICLHIVKVVFHRNIAYHKIIRWEAKRFEYSTNLQISPQEKKWFLNVLVKCRTFIFL
jgi:hypothetical protein